MHVVINALAVSDSMSGIGHHTLNLLHGLGKVDRENHYTLLVNPRPGRAPLVDRKNFREREIAARTHLWEQFQLPSLLHELNADVYHSPLLAVPLVDGCPTVVTVHDVIPRLFPELTPPRFKAYFDEQLAPSLQRADMVIAVSENTRRDLVQLYGVPQGEVRAIHQGVADRYRPLNHDQKLAALRTLNRYRITGEYLLFVGTIERRKNVPGLIDAFARLRGMTAGRLQLVLAGGLHQLDFDLRGLIDRFELGDRAIVADRVSDYELPHLYGMAKAFVFPSLYEGFGLPVLEAMSCGVPVVTSSTSSLPEIAKGPGLLVNPYDADEIARALYRVLKGQELRERMVRKGLQKAKLFSLEREARMTVAVYEHVACRKAKHKTEKKE